MGNVTLTNRETGVDEVHDESEVPALLASKKYIAPQAIAVRQFGEDNFASPDQVAQQGATAETIDPTKAVVAQAHQERKTENTGVVAAGKALGGGFVHSLTMGAVSPFQDEREFNQGADVAGQVAGVVAPLFAGDVAGLAGLAADPLSIEHAGASLSSSMLYGGELGEGAGAAERGLAKAQGALSDAADAHAAQAAVPADLAGLDKPGLKGAEQTELGRIEQERAPLRQQLADDIRGFRDDNGAKKVFLVGQDGAKSAAGEQVEGMKALAARASKADKSLRALYDDPIGFAQKPEAALKGLRMQQSAFEEMIAKEPELRTAFAGDETGARAAALDALPGQLEKNKALQQRIAELTAEPSSPRLTAIGAARDALSAPKPVPPPVPEAGLPQRMLEGSVFGAAAGLMHSLPIPGSSVAAHVVGAKAASFASDLVFGKLGKTIAASTGKAADVADAVVNTGAKVTRSAIPLATTTLGAVRYAAPSSAATAAAAEPKDLSGLFAKRSAEVKSQTAYDEAGYPRMTPPARAAVAERLAPVRAVSPVLADRLETMAARRIEYLSAALPRMPDIAAIPAGLATWQPSNMEMRTWARKAAAVEDPAGVERRIIDGSLTPEDVEAYRAVYPQRAQALTQAVLGKVAEGGKSIPFQRRLALSMFTGQALDPALDPRILSVLQGQYAKEDGSQGGTQSPTPKPAFGSVKVPDYTASEKREMGDGT
jgi:hypothetical protein